MKPIFETIIAGHTKLAEKILEKEFQQKILKSADMLVSAIKNNKKVLLCGNGGSAADCQHFSGEMIGKFLKERKSVPFISLTTNTSILTCIGNDYSFDNVFSRQIEGTGNPGDILIAFSTSGASKNIINAVKTAKNKKMKIISFTGKNPNPIEKISHLSICVDSKNTPRIQEIHIILIHIICLLVEETL